MKTNLGHLRQERSRIRQLRKIVCHQLLSRTALGDRQKATSAVKTSFLFPTLGRTPVEFLLGIASLFQSLNYEGKKTEQYTYCITSQYLGDVVGVAPFFFFSL
jgi:hypothetical protein